MASIPRSMSYAQERMWFLQEMNSGNPLFNRACPVRLTGQLDIEILKRSLDTIVRRHEILRVRFPAEAGVPRLAIMQPESVELPVKEWEHLPIEERASALKTLIVEEARRIFHLSEDKLFRFLLVRLSSAEHVLVMNFHHIIFDAWSVSVLLNELLLLYQAFLTGYDSPLPELPRQYGDCAERQREWVKSVLAQETAFWKSQLGNDSPVLELPFDSPRPQLPRHLGKRYCFTIPLTVADQIRSICRQDRVTPFMFLLTVFQVLLYRYSSQEEFVVGCLVAGRTYPDTERLIGLFVNALPIKVTVNPGHSFRETLCTVRKIVISAYDHQEMPFDRLVTELSPARTVNINPLFQTMFNMHNMPRLETVIPGLTVECLEYDYEISLVDVTLQVSETNGIMACSLIYDTDLFETATIERMAGHFLTMIAGILDAPDTVVSKLPLLTESEKKLFLLHAGNPESSDQPIQCIHEYFEAQAAKSPESIALLYEEQAITYGALNQQANQLAHYLRGLGVGPEMLVAILLASSPSAIVCMLAILKAGGAYLPLDLSYPSERLSYLLDDSEASFAIVDTTTANTVQANVKRWICLDSEASTIAACSADNPSQAAQPNNLAYVIYTSGSTGRPKGVENLHQGIARLVKNIDYAQIGPEEVFLQLTSISFDVSAFEIYGSLLNGGSLVLMGTGRPSIAEIGQAIRKYCVTSLCITPQMLDMVLAECPKDLTGLRQVFAAGDVLPVPLARKVLAQLPCRLINAYGPTENAVYSTCYSVEQITLDDRSIPIGRPIANDCAYILDQQLQPVPVGIAGGLYVSGLGIARGYRHNQQMTAERFLDDPFIPKPGVRMYKTGDIARRLSDGNIEFIGRADNQIKIRGCRVEPGEIEAVIRQHPYVKQAIVLTRKTSAENELNAYVVIKAGECVSKDELRSFVRSKLPEYMVPVLFTEVPYFPLTPAGKIDYKALPEPLVVSAATRVLPRTPTEASLTQMWERLLSLPAVGITDNFFALGGHSLMAMRLFAEIERTFHTKLSVSIIFSDDTIEKLAKVIDGADGPSLSSALVPIQTKGKKPPLFCVHALDGEVLSYYHLALQLGENQPVYAFKLVESATDTVSLSVKQLATQYIKEMLGIQPKGPYFLAGHSFGGLVAYEMAQQIYQAGQKVALLALFDTRNLQCHSRRTHKRELRAAKRANSIRKWRSAPDKGHYFVEKIKKEWQRLKRRLQRIAGIKIRGDILRRIQYEYIPVKYPGEITVFRAIDANDTAWVDAKLGWDGLAELGVVVCETPGDHGSLVQQSNIAQLAERFAVHLGKAQATTTKRA